jgi:hypothetical protein
LSHGIEAGSATRYPEVIAKGMHELEVLQYGGYFSRTLKRERLNNHAFKTILKLR